MPYLGARRTADEEEFPVPASDGQDDHPGSGQVVRHLFRGDQGSAKTSERQPGVSEPDEILLQ
jgi:hypothetical protein